MLVIDFKGGIQVGLKSESGEIFSDNPYNYAMTIKAGERDLRLDTMDSVSMEELRHGRERREWRISGVLGKAIRFHQTFTLVNDGMMLDEVLSLTNMLEEDIFIESVEFGFCKSISKSDSWRWTAIPFRVQPDGSLHDYSTADLIDGRYSNSDVHGPWMEGIPKMVDKKMLRSEAWLLRYERGGLLVAKYNNAQIEMSMAQVEKEGERNPETLRFGGIGLSLLGEPSSLRLLKPGQTSQWGMTRYQLYEGSIPEGAACYKMLLAEHGHGFPRDYNPPLNWNVLYDRGWHHSDQEKLNFFFTKESLFQEAQKASEIGCELLYLDPGWEECEGTSKWGSERLGEVGEFIKEVDKKYGLKVGFRDTGFLYRDEFPHDWYWSGNKWADRGRSKVHMDMQHIWRFCACSNQWRDEKVKRIAQIAKNGMKFLMIDEYAWFGPCFAEDHGHRVPTTAEDHVLGIFELIKSVRRECPDLVVEAHDSIWPWCMRYLPVYFRQGFDLESGYQENWGFEFMWESVGDLQHGKALSLYYYALATDIPAYLHISMIPDNDRYLFFWWAASTVRHLGIGGKYHTYAPSMRDKYCPDPDKRWYGYKKTIALYKRLKPFFARGQFHGINEQAHLHTLPDEKGGVLNLFNLGGEKTQLTVDIPANLIGCIPNNTVECRGPVEYQWTGNLFRIKATLDGLSPVVVVLGDAVQRLKGMCE